MLLELSALVRTLCVMDQVLDEVGGKLLLPPLVRVPGGWAEQGPEPCSCGGLGYLVGWVACSCRSDTLAPGHRTWQCAGCATLTRVGCLGLAGQGPMESYGCRRS